MTDSPPSPKRRRQDPAPTCKTCTACRRKKIKCDSARPSCRACTAAGCECVYVEDTRRINRPSRTTVERLEASVASLWERLQHAEARTAAAFVPPSEGTRDAMGAAEGVAEPVSPDPLHHASPSVMHPCVPVDTAPVSNDPSAGLLPPAKSRAPADGNLEDAREATELSPQEISVVGLVQAQDGAFSVHGMSSLLHNTASPQKTAAKSQSHAAREQERAATQARLVSNAALQRQREYRLFRTPSTVLDLDGLDAETARHLFDLHWNRQHYAYLLTYRPAVIDSLSVGGPWANKLLLNAIYYSSSVYSERACFKPAEGGDSPLGSHFYQRFKTLLVDALTEPSVTSAAALLLMGSNMASQGNLSAGWNFCGLAYRMIVDLGGHLMAGPRQPNSDSGSLNKDIEREMRKRLYWGAFIIDTTQSMYFGRPTSLPLAEARVPTELLDTYEELEEWTPYVDPTTDLASNDMLLSYVPQPAYAVSTFSHLARLFRVGSRVLRGFYSLESVNLSISRAVELKQHLEGDLHQWLVALPKDLCFNPEVDSTPPPHQINPHTSYHTLMILMKRPFSRNGHLQHCTSEPTKAKDAAACVSSALMIWKLVAAYRNAFTLRRAAYLVVYAMYSAVVVLLVHGKGDQQQHSTAISFFWSALSEQRQWFAGLHKPMAIIRETMTEFGHQNMLADQTQLSSSAMGDLAQLLSGESNDDPSGPADQLNQDAMGFMGSDDNFHYEPFDFLEDHERVISDDALFGLFAPQQDFL